MTKKSQHRRTHTGKKRQKADAIWSLAIPISVGVVMLVILIGAIVLAENRRAGAGALSENLSAPIVTIQPAPTQPLPYPEVPRVSVEVAQSLLEQGQAVLIDVRSKQSYDQSHAAGALAFPEDTIESRLTELPTGKALILY